MKPFFFFLFSPDKRQKSLIRWAKSHKIDFPTKVAELESVQQLNIKLKGVSKLPKEIDCLVNLTEIDASYNNISELPWEFRNLKKLKVINFSHNRLIDIPGVICQQTQLIKLNLEGNLIKKVPPTIANLVQLEELNISFNQIIDIPAEVSSLKHIKIFNLAANNLSSLPQSMHKLYNLQELVLWKNTINEVPDFIKQLPNIKEIDLNVDSSKINQLLIMASISNDVDKARKMILLGADVNFQWQNSSSRSFTTALFEAASVDMIKLLLEHGADPNLKREIIKAGSNKSLEGEKQTGEFETFITKKHSAEVIKYLKTLNQPQ